MNGLEEATVLKKTPLYDRHVSLGGKIVDFSGWALPVYYSSILAEHEWTRSSCSFFDVSHLGEICVSGPDAAAFLQAAVTCDIRKATPGKVVYGMICDEAGYALDDILIYGTPNEYFVIVNASNIETDFEALSQRAKGQVHLSNDSDRLACIAVQGPGSERILEKLFGFPLSRMEMYTHDQFLFNGKPVWVSRTGYTGEDGFEIFSENDRIGAIWDILSGAGSALGAKPAGLGARNTLRLEAGNPLYGHELDRRTTPLEAGLVSAVSFEKGDFVGRKALAAQKEAGLQKKLAAFRVLDRSIPRDGYPVYHGGSAVGTVTSGSFAPTVGAGIGMAFVPPALAQPDTIIQIKIHERLVDARIVRRPFVPHKRKKNS